MNSPKIEEWVKTTINGRVAARMKEILREKGDDEPIYKSNDRQESILFRGREMSIGLIVTGVKVGDIPDDDDYTYTVYLGDIIACPEFREALRREDINYSVSDRITLKECCIYLGEEYDDLKNTIEPFQQLLWSVEGFKFENLAKEFSKKYEDFLKQLNWRISHFYIGLKYGRLNLYARHSFFKYEILEKGPSFLECMAAIKQFFEVNKQEVEQLMEEGKTVLEKIKKKPKT